MVKSESFYAKGNRSGNVLHIETDGAIVNIRVGLHDSEGNPVTVVDVLPEDESRSPDLDGHYWHTEDADGNDTKGAHVRVVRQPREGSKRWNASVAVVELIDAPDASTATDMLRAKIRASGLEPYEGGIDGPGAFESEPTGEETGQ